MTTQNYIPTDIDHAQKTYEEWEAGRTRTTKPPVGKSIWAILPARAGASQGATPFKTGDYVHFLRDPMNVENVFAVGICPSKTRNAPCTGCGGISKLKRTGNAADIALAEGMSAREAILCNAVRLDVDETKVEILQVPATVYKVLNQILRDRADGFDFTNPMKMKTVIVERTGTGKNDTKYTCRLSQREIPLPKMEWLDNMEDLDKVFDELDMVEVGKVFAGELPAQREAATPAASDRQVAGAEPQRQIAGASPEPDDLVEDPISGKMVPASSLKK